MLRPPLLALDASASSWSPRFTIASANRPPFDKTPGVRAVTTFAAAAVWRRGHSTMRGGMLRHFSIAVLIAVAISACSSEDPRVLDCAGAALPFAPGIDLQVRDPYGVAQAIGTNAVVTRSTGETVYSDNYDDTLNVYSAINVPGTFSVTLTRSSYQPFTLGNIIVVPDGCTVKRTTVPVTLQLAPGAPALRSIALVSVLLPNNPDNSFQLLAHFDADPAVPRTVTWTSSDTTMATVDTNGIVISKCAKTRGTATITATSTVDSSIRASTPVAAMPAASCP